MSTPEDLEKSASKVAPNGPKRYRWTYRSLELERGVATQETARHRVVARLILDRSGERGLRVPEPDTPSAPSSNPSTEKPPSPEAAGSLIAEQIDACRQPQLERPSGDPRDGFDPCRESPWWRLEDRSGQ